MQLPAFLEGLPSRFTAVSCGHSCPVACGSLGWCILKASKGVVLSELFKSGQRVIESGMREEGRERNVREVGQSEVRE